MKTRDQFWSSPSTGLVSLSWGACFWLLFASMVNGLITSALDDSYIAEGNLFPLKDYVGLFSVKPADAHSGKFIFREYFDDLGRVEGALLPHGVIAVFKQALGNLARLVGGTEYAMSAVSRP